MASRVRLRPGPASGDLAVEIRDAQRAEMGQLMARPRERFDEWWMGGRMGGRTGGRMVAGRSVGARGTGRGGPGARAVGGR